MRRDATPRDQALAKSRADGGVDFFRFNAGPVDTAPAASIEPDDAMATARDGFTADGTTLYWTGSRGRDTAALIAEDVASAQRTVLGEHRKADVRPCA